MKKQFTVLSVLALAVVGVAQAEAQDALEIGRQAQAQWSVAVGQGNPAEVANLYTADAIVKPPFETAPRVMQEGVSEYWTGALKDGLSDYQVNIVNGEQQGDVAYVSGFWAAVPRGADQTPVGGYLVRVLEKQGDGTWKIAMEQWY